MTLEEARAHVGSRVTCTTYAREAEPGVISSVNGSYAFVRYDGRRAPQATMPEHLTLMRGEHVSVNAGDAGFPVAGDEDAATAAGRDHAGGRDLHGRDNAGGNRRRGAGRAGGPVRAENEARTAGAGDEDRERRTDPQKMR